MGLADTGGFPGVFRTRRHVQKLYEDDCRRWERHNRQQARRSWWLATAGWALGFLTFLTFAVVLSLAVTGCCAPVRAPARAIARDLPLYVSLTAPVGTLTTSQRSKTEQLGRALVDNSRLLEEAVR